MTELELNHSPGLLSPRRIAIATVTAIALAWAATNGSAGDSQRMLIGIFDQGATTYEPTQTFGDFAALHVQVIRMNLEWGGPHGVAQQRPLEASDPNDPAYDWSLYDRTVTEAASRGIEVLFSILGTPAWENGGAGWNRAPVNPGDLEQFALAAATRYGGSWLGPDGKPLARVHLWAAWNEPNNPVFLRPQYRGVGGHWIIESARQYARICEAIFAGVHAAHAPGDEVACGLTAPHGNNNPNSTRPSVAPLTFLDAVVAAGLKHVDAWAHHPYYSSPSQIPSAQPQAIGNQQKTTIILGNITTLINEVTRKLGPIPVWITEYGYQTNPPNPYYGVSWADQAAYLSQAFVIARRNPRIQLMLWFLLKDEPNQGGWQSGLETTNGRHKPSYAAFQKLRT